MEKLFIAVHLVAVFCCASSNAAFGYAPFYRYSNGEYFYTTNILEIGTAVPGQRGSFGYVSEGVQCIVSTEPGQGLKPLYRYGNGIDHFYTTNANEIGTTVPGVTGNYGYVSEGIAAYCYAMRRLNTVPLYRYYNGVHFYTTNANEIGTIVLGHVGRYGYKYEGVACYVFPYGGTVKQ